MSSVLRASVAPSVEAIVTDTAMRADRVVAVGRMILAIVSGLRSYWIWSGNGWKGNVGRAFVAYPAMGVPILFSIVTLLGLWRPRRFERFLLVSVTCDALCNLAALLPNALWPWEGTLRIGVMPDVSSLLLVMFAAGLRQSPRVAWLGAGLGAASFALIVATDRLVSGPNDIAQVHTIVMYAILIAGAAVLTVALATQTRNLVLRAAEAAVGAHQAKAHLGAMIGDHHDVRSLLASATVNADLLTREPGRGDLARNLRSDLDEVASFVDAMGDRAHADLMLLSGKEGVDVAGVVTDVVDVVRHRFPATRVEAEPVEALRALVAGGRTGLRRLLFNLLVNACEGDGRRVASRVDVRVMAAASGRVAIEVADDGPGFPPAALDGDLGAASTSKPEGWGMGLALVAELVRASGGAVHHANRSSGGASVTVELETVAA